MQDPQVFREDILDRSLHNYNKGRGEQAPQAGQLQRFPGGTFTPAVRACGRPLAPLRVAGDRGTHSSAAELSANAVGGAVAVAGAAAGFYALYRLGAATFFSACALPLRRDTGAPGMESTLVLQCRLYLPEPYRVIYSPGRKEVRDTDTLGKKPERESAGFP
ncbi:unnamed protein product [Sphagnum tenellum]